MSGEDSNREAVNLLNVFRTIKVALPYDNALFQTAIAFNRACQLVLDYGSQAKTYNKNKLNRETYRKVRESVPNLPSALVQTARDQASEMLKRSSLARTVKKQLSVRYDRRTFKFYPDSNRVSLTTVFGRINFPFKRYAYMDKWKGEYTNAQLLIKRRRAFLNIQVKLPDKPRQPMGQEVLGIDRGIMNIAVCSDNSFYNSNHLRAVKGRYEFLKHKLQSAGTRSAKRHLQRLSGRERRFARSVNHIISKAIVNKPYKVFALEKLNITKKKTNGKQFNRKLGSWSFSELQRFISYKAEELGKLVVPVNPRHTSQTCSRCGYVDRKSRQGRIFKCRNCGFELNADLNAAHNIALLGKIRVEQAEVNQPIVASDETTPTGIVDDSYKPTLFRGG